MKRFHKITAWLLAIAILLCAIPFSPIVVSADVAVNNSANKIATIEKSALTGTTTFTGGSANFSVNLTGVVEGVYKVAYYFSLGELAANAQITLQPYGADVNTVITYEDLQIYPNGKIAAVVVIRASENFTISGTVTGLSGTIDKIVVTKDSYDLGSAAELGLYVMYGEDIAQNAPADYIQPGDTEWIQSIPMGLATTYMQQWNVSSDYNLYLDVFDALGATFYEEDLSFTNKNYFDETWDALVATSGLQETTTGITDFSLAQIAKTTGEGVNAYMYHWSGTIKVADTSSRYIIRATMVDNGLYIKIGDTVAYEYWGNGAYFDDDNVNLDGSEFTLNAGTEYPIDIYYVEFGGGEALQYSLGYLKDVTSGSGCNATTTTTFNTASFSSVNLTREYYRAMGFVADKEPFEALIPGGGGPQSHTFEGNDYYDESIAGIEELVVPVTTIRKNTFVISSESDFRSDLTNLGFAMNGGDGPDGCYVQYTGYVTADEDGEYQFGLTKVDNGVMVQIGDTRVIEYWGTNTWWDNGGDSIYMDGVSVTMKAGESLPITVTYLELGGGEGLTFVVKKDGGTEIDLTSSSLVFSTMPLKGVITENIPQLEETSDRVLFHTDFTSTDNFTIQGSPAINTDKGIMIMNADDYIEMGVDMFKDVGLSTTFEFVVKPSKIVEHAAFAGIGTADEQNWVIMGMRKDGAVKFGMRTINAEVGAQGSGKTEGGMLAVGTWTKLKYVFTETTVSIYVNDVLKTTLDSAGQKDLSQIDGNFIFGKELKWGDPGFTGTVSEIRVTTTEQVLKIRDEETNLLLQSYTASDLAGSSLQLESVELDGYICNGWKDAEGNAVESATVGTTIYADLIAINHPISTGRQLRISTDSTGGLRFRATIERDEFYNYFNEMDADYVYSEDSNYTFGMLIIPADLLPDGEEIVLETSRVLNIVGKKVYNQKNEYGDLEYTGVVTHIPESQYGRLLLARPYLTYEYEGRSYTIYGDDTAFGEYQGLARQVYADGAVDASVKNALVTMLGEAALQMQDVDAFATNKSSGWVAYERAKNIDEGMEWPEGQAFPTFATPAEKIDAIGMDKFTDDEKVAFATLQGLVNKTQPRIHITESYNDRGDFVIAPTIRLDNRNFWDETNKYELLQKYVDEIDGLVLYSTANSTHYRNLAATVAGTKNALPVTQEVYNTMLNNGIDLPILVDLTGLTYTTAIDIYTYMHNNYWKDCTKRLILSMPPDDKLTYIRDIAAATGAAIVWLDNQTTKERDVYDLFLQDMADDPSTSAAMGWYTEERSGMGSTTRFGIGTVPSDFFTSPTVYSGTDHVIQQPKVPLKGAVENKVYVALFVSDGDNIQVNQGYQKELWDTSAAHRGQVAINWTISPALVDIAPGILNYYYSTATPKDCFVSGPSGLGYLLPIDTGSTTETQYLTDDAYADTFTKLTGKYMERAGLRVVTIWEDMLDKHRTIYADNARYLYGATVHKWNDNPLTSVDASVNGKLNVRFHKLEIPYVSGRDHLYNEISADISDWNGNSPKFVAYQASIWSNDTYKEDGTLDYYGDVERPEVINAIYDQLKAQYGDKFEFVRADHFYALYNEANNTAYNLCLDESTTVTTSASDDDAAVLRDGSTYTLWTSKTRYSQQYVQFDLGSTHSVSRYVIRFAGSRGMSAEYNARAFHVEVSTDGNNWTTVDTYVENIADVVDIDITATNARYVKFVIDDAEGDGYARIADIEIYGK